MNPLRLILSFLASALVLSSASGYAAPAPSSAPAAEAKTSPAAAPAAKLGAEEQKIWDYMVELFDASRLSISKKPSEKNTARAKMAASMDWDRVATDCLGKGNAKKHGAQFGKFKSLLSEVVLKTAYSRMETFWQETTYSAEKVEVKGGEAFVRAKFNVKGEPFFLDYYLAKRGRWQIYDIAFEDLRYSANINEQIDAFLKEKPFADLLEKLRKRVAELDGKA